MAALPEALLVYREGPGGRLPEQLLQSGVYTLFSPTDFVIPPNGVALLYLQISVRVPWGYTAHFSSLREQVRDGIFVGADYVEPSTVAELKVLLFNHSWLYYQGSAGDPVARLVLRRTIFPPVQEATVV
nr:E4-1 [Simian adenovirus GZ3-12]